MISIPRKDKIYDSVSDKVQAWQAEKTDRIVLQLRKDAPLNKAFIQRLAAASGSDSVTELILTALGEYAVNHHGLDWLEANKNKPEESGGKGKKNED